MTKLFFSDKEIAEIIDMYLNQQMSLKKIGNILHCSQSPIKRILLENDIKLRKRTHTYKANYRVFQKIDSEEKAYWLGFLAADGNIMRYQTRATISINLGRKDRGHLEKFKAFLESDAPIVDHTQNAGFSNDSLMSKISIHSVDMADDLIDKNVVPNKSLILQPPNIHEDFFIPYIRGYFDGDGSLHESNGSWRINFEGTEEMLKWINMVLDFQVSKLTQRYPSHKNSYTMVAGGYNKVVRITNTIYKDANIFLDRKYEKYLLLLKSRS